MKPRKSTPEFLSGGGEMGELMRSLDWSKTPVGPIDNWPQSLKTILSLLLNSKFPMFLWWGPDLICFYNDAYRPSLGQNGKHPSILGTPAKEAWAEIWPVIGPLIESVLATGEATWFEDQLVPIFRNGHIEDVYWTFSYSPVADDSGKRAGVFVTCTETTGKVILFKGLEESNKRFLNNILQAPVAMCIFRGKNHVVEIANERMLELWGKDAEAVMNKPIFEGLPEVRGQGLEQIVDHVYETGERFTANERPVTLPRNGQIETVYVNFTYEALREPNGTISGIVAIATDVSPQVIARQKTEESERDIRNMVLQAPIGICIVDAATLVSEIVNESFIEVAGKPYEEIAGKYYWDTFAEAKPYYESAMASVVEEGKPFFANEVPLMLIRHGKEEQIYATFVYAPLKTVDGKVKKVAIWVLENTSQVVARQKIGEAEERLRNMIIQAPVAMCILTGPNFIVELANEKMFELWGRTSEEMMDNPLFETVHEARNHGFEELIESVYKTGQTISRQSVATTFLRDGNLAPGYVDVIYHPYRNTDGTIRGVLAVATDTTPQVLAHKKIEEAEERLRNTILQAPVAMCILIGPEFVVELANTKMFELWGKTSVETVGKPLFEGVYEAKDQGFEDWIGSVYKTGETISVEGAPALLNRNGKVEQAYVNVIYQAYRNAMGTIIGVLAIAVDVTAQVIAHKKIEEAEEKARLAIRSADLGVYEIIYATNKMYTDERFREIWGIGETTERKKYTDAIHPDDWPQRIKAHEESLKTGHLEYRARVIWKDQSFRWVRINGKINYDDKGKPVKLLGIIQDITSTVIQQQELQENEKRLNIVIEASELGMWELNLKTYEVSCSDRYVEIFGYRKGTSINHTQLLKHIHPYDMQARVKSVEEAIISGILYHKMRIITKDNSIRWIETKGKVFYDQANKPDKMMGTIRDITQEKQREYELLESEVILDKLVKERTRQLERSNEDLQQFAHVASHDLKEPLRKIKMYTSRLEDGYAKALPPKALEYLTQVTGASTRMQMMIDGVLSFQLLIQNEPIEKVNLNNILEDIKSDLEIPIEQKKAIFIIDKLPEIEGAGLLLYQLFYNLVSNSLKFSKPDTAPVIKINASIVKKEEKEYAKISVTDNGIGFDQQYAEQIFTTFVRLNSKDKYEGTGLGLSLCKKIAERHGGTIEATGTENDGATFMVMLPLIQPTLNL